MALRIRRDGSVVCAAENPPMEGDTYIDDGQQYALMLYHASRWSPTSPYGKPDEPKPCWEHPDGTTEPCVRCEPLGLRLKSPKVGV